MTTRNIAPLTPVTPLRWKSSPREQEEEEKAMERSRFGMPRDEEEGPRGKAAGRGNEEEDRRAAEGQQHQVDGAIAHDRTKSVDELSTKAQAGNMDDMARLEPTEGLDRYYRTHQCMVSLAVKLVMMECPITYRIYEVFVSRSPIIASLSSLMIVIERGSVRSLRPIDRVFRLKWNVI